MDKLVNYETDGFPHSVVGQVGMVALLDMGSGYNRAVSMTVDPDAPNTLRWPRNTAPNSKWVRTDPPVDRSNGTSWIERKPVPKVRSASS